MNTDKLLKMLLEAIDYSFLQTDGSYDKTLTYPVIDKIQYIKEQVKDIEVKEVDLSLIEPHIKEEWSKINTGHTYSIIDSYNIFVGICTYFYELGLKAQKGE